MDLYNSVEAVKEQEKGSISQTPTEPAKKFTNEAREDVIDDDATKVVEKKLTETEVRDDEDGDSGKGRCFDIFEAKTVKVTGCGAHEANGLYERSGMCNRSPQFVRTGEWNGKRATFHLWRHWLGYWYLGVRGVRKGQGGTHSLERQGSIELYKYKPNDSNDVNLLGKDWVVGTDGVAPTPIFEAINRN
jgi:hypothetical protein